MFDASDTLTNKSYRSVDRVEEEILRGTIIEGFQGPGFPTRDTPIDHLHDPVLFADAITTAFSRQGSLAMPPYISYIRIPPQTSSEALTALREAVLK